MEQEKREQLLLQKERITRILSRKEEQLANLAKEGWIEGYLAKRGERFHTFFPHLKLRDVDPTTQFSNLINHVGPLQTAIKDGRLPLLKKRLAKITETLTAPLVITPPSDAYIVEPAPIPLRSFASEIFSRRRPMKEFLEKAVPAHRFLMREFLVTPESAKIFNSIATFTPSTDHSIDDFNKGLAGAIFEELAYLHLSQNYLRGNSILLSPRETYTLFRNARRGGGAEHRMGVNYAIAGVSFPDGLVITDTPQSLEIRAMAEYKNFSDRSIERNRKNSERQLSNYNPILLAQDLKLSNGYNYSEFLGRLIHQMHPRLKDKPLIVNPNLKLIYVVPLNSSLSVNGAQKERVQITTDTIGGFLTVLLKTLGRSDLANERK